MLEQWAEYHKQTTYYMMNYRVESNRTTDKTMQNPICLLPLFIQTKLIE